MSPYPIARSPGRAWIAAAAFGAALSLQPSAGAAQDLNFILPIPDLEVHLRDMPFQILDWRGSRMPGDRTQNVLLEFEDHSVLRAKWASAPVGGGAFNNEPRYEVAAYEIQKLFLDPADYVVPPTVVRAFPHAYVDAQIPGTPRTFREAESVLVALQYWLSEVTPRDFWQPRRAREDDEYARHIGNMNILTYLIRHSDNNEGNFLISREGPPRVFSVDNGVAFRSPASDRGYAWRQLQVPRLPEATVERLRELTEEDFHRALAVLAEYRIEDGQLVPVPVGENLAPNRGIRVRDGRVQIGLTAAEIRDVDRRRRQLVERVERGRVDVF